MSASKKTALAVRPYGDRIRKFVFKVLEEACVTVQAPEDLREGTNEELIGRLKGHRSDLLVIPFNVVRDDSGERTNGLELLRMIRESVAWTSGVTVIMPVSVFAKVAFEAAFKKHALPDVFVLHEEDLDSPDLPQRLEAFCSRMHAIERNAAR